MRKHTWLQFENDEKLNAFMRQVMPAWFDSYTLNSRIGGGFNRNEITIAKKDFGAKVLEKKDGQEDAS